MNSALKLFVLVALIGLINASFFFRGRRFHHRKHESHQKLVDIPDQYYDQRLDHFNEAQTATWKQVYNLTLISLMKFNRPYFLVFSVSK